MRRGMQGFNTITYSKQHGIARITLDRPKTLNAYNMEMRDELYQVLWAAREDDEVGVVVFQGRGRAFCAGADLTEFGTSPSLAVAREVRWERDVWGTFLDVSKPLVAAIHGYCLGSGLEIALLCDIRIASDDAVFGLPEVGLGMLPAAGGTQTLLRVVGIPRALDLLLTRRPVGAAEAMDLGLVTKVVNKEALEQEAMASARHLLTVDPRALRAIKEAVGRGMDLPLQQALEVEEHLALRAMDTG